MITFRRQILLKAFKLFDLLGMVFSFALATSAAYYRIGNVSLFEFLSMRVKLQNFILFLGFLISWHLIFSLCGLYQSRRLSTRSADVIDVVKATSLGTLTMFIAGMIFKIVLITPVFLAVFWVASATATASGRLLMGFLLGQIRMRGRNLRHTLIVGTNSRTVRFAREIESKPELGYRAVGFVDDWWPGIEEFQRTGYAMAGNLDCLPALLRERVIDEVVIGLPIKSFYSRICGIVAYCEEQGIIVRFLSNIFNLNRARPHTEELEDNPVLSFYTGGMHGWSVSLKSAMDFVLSLVLIVVLSPLFLVTALLIKVTSPGPVFFVQERVGLNKRRFRLYKFRSMITDAEQKMSEMEHLNEVSGPVFKIREDPRITPIGKFLRRTSIDELPQLFNVLKGDMSLVGPRPMAVRDYNGFSQDWQRRRFSVRPGITCLWQIGGRNSLPFEKWMDLDMQYIDQWSLWLDLYILARTVFVVLTGRGAY